MLNVKMEFNAKGDGNTDDTVAVGDAIKAAQSRERGEAIYFPAGIYKLSSRLECDGKPISFFGDGKAHSILKWTKDSPNGGIVFSGGGQTGASITTFSVSDLTLATELLETSGTALELNFSSAGALPLKRVRIRDVEIAGWDWNSGSVSTGWSIGIHIRGSAGIDISHTHILGHPFDSDYGIICEALPDKLPRAEGGTTHFLSNLYITAKNGIFFKGPEASLEGVYLNNFEIVNCRTGFHAQGGTTYRLSNGHFDCYQTCGLFESVNEVGLQNIVFFHTSNSGVKHPANMVAVGDGHQLSIMGCAFFGKASVSDEVPVDEQNAISIGNIRLGQIIGNSFLDIMHNSIKCKDSASILIEHNNG